MHPIRSFRSRSRLPLLVLVGVVLITLVSIRASLGIQSDGVKMLKRDGSTISFGLPWKSGSTPPTGTKKAPVSALANYLNGISDVAEALAKGGIVVGEKGASNEANTLSILLKGGDGSDSPTPSLANSVSINLDLGELVNAASAIVGQVLSTASSASSVGALNATSSVTAGLNAVSSTTQACECSTCGCGMPTPSPSPGAGNSSHSGVSLALNATSSSCPAAPTVTCTETWHSTHYAGTATLYSFASVMTVTCTKTISLCPSSLSLNSTTITPMSTTLAPTPTGALPTAQTTTTSLPGPQPTSSLSPPGSTTSLRQEVVTTTSTSSNPISIASSTSLTTASIGPISIPIDVVAYGVRVLQEVESDLKGALSNVKGLTGNLLSDVLTQINSVIADALSAPAPIPSKISVVPVAVGIPPPLVPPVLNGLVGKS